jgi:hypothetical protein
VTPKWRADYAIRASKLLDGSSWGVGTHDA